MRMSSYDDWRVHGHWHTCTCGAEWSDSDGGPCHVECDECHKSVSVDDVDDDGHCPECVLTDCVGCGAQFPKSSENWTHEDVCVDCAGLLFEILADELEDILGIADPSDDDLIGQTMKARLAGESIPEKAQMAADIVKKELAKT